MQKTKPLITVFFSIILLSFSLVQSTYANEKTEIILAGIDNFMPYSGLDINGEPTGIYIDIMDHLFADTQYSYKANIMPFRRAITVAMKTNHVDGIIGVYDTPERRERFHYLDSAFLTQFHVSLFTLKDSPIKSSALSEVKEKTIGKKRGFLISPVYDNALKNKEFKVFEVESIDQLVSMLLMGRTDAFIFTANQVVPYIKKIHKDENVKVIEPPLRTGITYLALSKQLLKKMPDNFIPEMEEKMKQLEAKGVIEDIHQKYGVDLYIQK